MNTRDGIDIIESLDAVPAAEWDALAGRQPLLSHAFLHALEASGCASAKAGWAPCHLALRIRGRLAGAMPLYLKRHSYGEYVFDWGWAESYHRSGLRYYPKLLSAIPFTPVTCARLLAERAEDRQRLIEGALAFARDAGVSSLHCLFPTEPEAQAMQDAGMILRRTVQFHWQNAGYADFEDFTARMSHDKRKKIRQERRKIREAGIDFRRLSGGEASPAQWRFFFDCYCHTYRSHLSTPYLNLDFFLRLARTMPDDLLLVIASRAGKPVASSFFVRGADTLFGRYWGALEYHPGLHFECCYYQAIAHCIENRIARFEGGAQGEHKLSRGLLPAATVSAHWLARPEYFKAVGDFLRRETQGVAHYVDELAERSPFKHEEGAP